jgi:hypothetical protein
MVWEKALGYIQNRGTHRKFDTSVKIGRGNKIMLIKIKISSIEGHSKLLTGLLQKYRLIYDPDIQVNEEQ